MTARGLRVLMLSDVYFPRVNGVSTSIQTFRRDLAAAGCASVLVAPRYPASREEEPGIVRVRSRNLPLDPEDRLLVARDLDRAVRALPGAFDLVHVHTPFVAHYAGLRAARRLGIPVVETYHTFFEEYFHHYLPWVPRPLLQRLARTISRRQCDAVDAVIAPSPQMAESLRAYGVRPDIRVIPTGLDAARLAGGERARFRLAYGIAAARPVALIVGRVAHEKNIGFLIGVLDRLRRTLPEVLLVVAGEGPALDPLRREVAGRGLGGHVLFVGYLDRAGPLLDCYRAADVFVFASRTETQGLVLLEAMATGLPVVSTAVMGTKYVLAGARGAIVAREDEAEFSEAVEGVLRNSRLRDELRAAGAQFVEEHWSSRAMAEKLLDLYGDVLARRSARALRPEPVARGAARASVTE